MSPAQQAELGRAGDDVRLSRDRPSVYLTFVRVARARPLRPGQSGERVWLRLHNNTRWRISVPAFDVPEGYGDAVPAYEVRALPRPRGRNRGDCPLPIRGGPKLASIVELGLGVSMDFSIPVEHLCRNLYIAIQFNYGWEDTDDVADGREAQHYIYFYGRQVPGIER